MRVVLMEVNISVNNNIPGQVRLSRMRPKW